MPTKNKSNYAPKKTQEKARQTFSEEIRDRIHAPEKYDDDQALVVKINTTRKRPELLATIDRNHHPIRVITPIGGRSLTKQSFREQCDINAIIARWQDTGMLEHINKENPRYGDFSTSTDFRSALGR